MIEEEDEPTPGKEPLDQVVVPLSAERTQDFSEALARPPEAAALKASMRRVASRDWQTNVSEVFGMLEREGQPPITIEEMNEAGISKAAEDQKVLNTAQKRRRASSGGSHRRTERQ